MKVIRGPGELYLSLVSIIHKNYVLKRRFYPQTETMGSIHLALELLRVGESLSLGISSMMPEAIVVQCCNVILVSYHYCRSTLYMYPLEEI